MEDAKALWSQSQPVLEMFLSGDALTSLFEHRPGPGLRRIERAERGGPGDEILNVRARRVIVVEHEAQPEPLARLWRR